MLSTCRLYRITRLSESGILAVKNMGKATLLDILAEASHGIADVGYQIIDHDIKLAQRVAI